MKKDNEGSTFMMFGEHHFLLFSQDKATIPERKTLDSYPRCSFLLAAGEYEKTASKITEALGKVKQIGQRTGLGDCGLDEGLFFTDSEGNLLEVFKGNEGDNTRLHHLHFDTTRFGDSIEFYAKMLNLELQERSDSIALFKIATNQNLVLHRVTELSEVTNTPYRGRHFAFYVTDDNFHAIKAKLSRAGIQEQAAERDKHGPRDARGDGQLSMYFLEPSGFRMEIVNQDSIHFARKHNFKM